MKDLNKLIEYVKREYEKSSYLDNNYGVIQTGNVDVTEEEYNLLGKHFECGLWDIQHTKVVKRTCCDAGIIHVEELGYVRFNDTRIDLAIDYGNMVRIHEEDVNLKSIEIGLVHQIVGDPTCYGFNIFKFGNRRFCIIESSLLEVEVEDSKLNGKLRSSDDEFCFPYYSYRVKLINKLSAKGASRLIRRMIKEKGIDNLNWKLPYFVQVSQGFYEEYKDKFVKPAPEYEIDGVEIDRPNSILEDICI
ncbi:UNVERIFIED_ORG: hypothetical protein B2H98_08220 [Clostridium botulinum]